MARTKLVCTLGPASATPKMVQGLVRAGASVFRINFSHGEPKDHERMVALVVSLLVGLLLMRARSRTALRH